MAPHRGGIIHQGRLAPPFPKRGRLGVVDFPIEEIVITGPGVHLGLANLTLETARMPVGMLLPCRGVGQPAIRTVEKFDGPVARHSAIMQRAEHMFQSGTLPASMAGYSNP
jgi:hypothetical protein